LLAASLASGSQRDPVSGEPPHWGQRERGFQGLLAASLASGSQRDPVSGERDGQVHAPTHMCRHMLHTFRNKNKSKHF